MLHFLIRTGELAVSSSILARIAQFHLTTVDHIRSGGFQALTVAGTADINENSKHLLDG
jgi:hypothetical protein